jgi:hypothetical protein
MGLKLPVSEAVSSCCVFGLKLLVDDRSCGLGKEMCVGKELCEGVHGDLLRLKLLVYEALSYECMRP